MGSQSPWTAEQNKDFEMALSAYDKDDIPDRWEKIAEMVDEKTAEDIKKHYEELVQDVKNIEQGRVSLPKYKDDNEDGDENDNDNNKKVDAKV